MGLIGEPDNLTAKEWEHLQRALRGKVREGMKVKEFAGAMSGRRLYFREPANIVEAARLIGWSVVGQSDDLYFTQKETEDAEKAGSDRAESPDADQSG